MSCSKILLHSAATTTCQRQRLLMVKKNLVHLCEVGLSLSYNVLSAHTTAPPVHSDLQLSGPTASCDGQKELLCSEELSSAAKGKRFGGCLVQHRREKRISLRLEEAAQVQEADPHAGKSHQATRCGLTANTHHPKPARRHPSMGSASLKVTQLGGRTGLRCLEHGLGHL